MSSLEVTGTYQSTLVHSLNKNPFCPALDLVALKLLSFCDHKMIKVCASVSRYWSQLTTESTIPRPLIESTISNLKQELLEVSVATFDNAKEIAEVVVEAFSKGDCFRKKGQRRTSEKEVIEDMRLPGNRWYTIRYDKRIIAAMLYTSDSQEASSVHMLSSHPDYWGYKVGTSLMAIAKKVAIAQGKIYLTLSAAHTNVRLIKYYETLGFKKTIDCKEEEYFSPELQKEYLIPEYQGYEEDGKAKLRNYDMVQIL